VQLQQAQYEFGATQAMNRAWASAVKPDENGQMQIDRPTLTRSLSDAGYGSQIPGIMENLNKFDIPAIMC
jgi:hypothetical protein